MLDSENVIVKRLVEEVSENVVFGSCNRPPLVRWENPRRDVNTKKSLVPWRYMETRDACDAKEKKKINERA